MKQSVIQYVLSRLYQLGITDVFGVPGDYAFPINDAISEDKYVTSPLAAKLHEARGTLYMH